jgi:tRNA1Val (adenine37-N6)-methyltransferase
MASSPFRFKQFALEQEGAPHPVGTDGVLLGAWADVTGARYIADIGTGTGLIALMLAQRAPEATVDAIELQETAAAIARANVARSPWPNRVRVSNASAQAFAAQHTGPLFDLLVSNPPFFTGGLVAPDAARRLARSADTLPPAELADCARRLLAPEGRFCVILPVVEGRAFIETAALRGLHCTCEVAVHSRADKPVQRLLLEFRLRPGHFRRDMLCIYASDHTRSAEYQRLTAAFYL